MQSAQAKGNSIQNLQIWGFSLSLRTDKINITHFPARRTGK